MVSYGDVYKKNLHSMTIKSSFVPKLVGVMMIIVNSNILVSILVSYVNGAKTKFYYSYLLPSGYVNIFTLFIIITPFFIFAF